MNSTKQVINNIVSSGLFATYVGVACSVGAAVGFVTGIDKCSETISDYKMVNGEYTHVYKKYPNLIKNFSKNITYGAVGGIIGFFCGPFILPGAIVAIPMWAFESPNDKHQNVEKITE